MLIVNNDAAKRGSKTARNGFKNEKEAMNKFNSWKEDDDSKNWLMEMNYDIGKIESVNAFIVSGQKTDIYINIKSEGVYKLETIQVKLVSNKKGFNQIDKRWVDAYKNLWDMPEDIAKTLKHFTGELPPYKAEVKDKRRMFLSEINEEEIMKLVIWINKNKEKIVSDIFMGKGESSAKWFLVFMKADNLWTIKSTESIIKYFSEGTIHITKRGSLKIGKISVQRKGGDAGRKTAKMLQFKIDPSEIFEINKTSI